MPKQKKTAKPPKPDAKPKIKARVRKKQPKVVIDDASEFPAPAYWLIEPDAKPSKAPSSWWDGQMERLFNLFSRK
jgi:hypothetical protein